MPDLDELAKIGGVAGVLAATVAFLYRRQTATNDERIESYKAVVANLEKKLAEKNTKIEELYERISKTD